MCRKQDCLETCLWFHGSSRAESPGMCGGGQEMRGEGQAATDYRGPVFNAGKFRFDSVCNEKSFQSWKDIVIYVLWKSHSYIYAQLCLTLL